MTDKGFFHPDLGYWQTIGQPSEKALVAYPEGTVEVPLRPGAHHEWTGVEWVNFGAPSPTLDAYAAQRRWEIETGGITVAGTAIRTDRESQALINGALSLAQADPGATIEFKRADGWVMLKSAEMAAIALAVGRHVQAAFAAERAVSEAIASQEITTTEEVDAAFAALLEL